MKKSEMNDIQKANYEYMRSIGIKKSWAKRLLEGDGDFVYYTMTGYTPEYIVRCFTNHDTTGEGRDFWNNVRANADVLLMVKSYHQALLEIPNNLAKKAE